MRAGSIFPLSQVKPLKVSDNVRVAFIDLVFSILCLSRPEVWIVRGEWSIIWAVSPPARVRWHQHFRWDWPRAWHQHFRWDWPLAFSHHSVWSSGWWSLSHVQNTRHLSHSHTFFLTWMQENRKVFLYSNLRGEANYTVLPRRLYLLWYQNTSDITETGE